MYNVAVRGPSLQLQLFVLMAYSEHSVIAGERALGFNPKLNQIECSFILSAYLKWLSLWLWPT